MSRLTDNSSLSSGCLVSSHHWSSLITRHSCPLTNFHSSSPHQSLPTSHQHCLNTSTTIPLLPPHAVTLLSVGSLLHLDHHRHYSQHCASHQQLTPSVNIGLLSYSPHVDLHQPDLQHAIIHTPSCIMVQESPCSRCFISLFTDLFTGR